MKTEMSILKIKGDFKMKINKEVLKKVGGTGLLIGKKIVVEGSMAVVITGLTTGVTLFFTKGVDGLRKTNVVELLELKKKEKKAKVKVEAELVEAAEVAEKDEEIEE